ncbi:MAG: carboxypeptidase regulatory-like domain-containing protein [Deltaproteobacteria bacterium]|nr:MAG: carboxypeptidase regulatory-like domain-containing protein [Deltaproteobacteria bacterium]
MKRSIVPVALAAVALALGCGPSASQPAADAGAGGADAAGPGGCTGASCYNHCPDGKRTALTGVVRAPNGIDPVPGAAVYVPKGTVTEFPPEVACEVCDQLQGISIVSTTTATDGSFRLEPVPTAANQAPGESIVVVTQMGRFRSVQRVPIANPCEDNAPGDEYFRLPSRDDGATQSIPRIAVASGDYDVMECVLLKLGIEQGQFDIYEGQSLGADPAAVDTFDNLLRDLARMKSYNIIFINCTGNTYENLLSDATVRANIENYVLSGGRLYVTDWSYDYIEQIPNWAPLIDFEPGASGPDPEPVNAAAIGPGDIEVDATVRSPDLAEWLVAVEEASGDEIINASNQVHVQHFLASWVEQYQVAEGDGVTVWLEGNADGQRPLTTTFDYEQCGRVLYSSYHTEGRGFGDLGGSGFPNYCSSGPLTPQERVLEYLIFHIADCIDVE